MAFQYHTIGAVTLSAGAWTGVGLSATTSMAITKGSQSIVNDVDQSGESQISTWIMGRQFTGNLGTATSPAKFGVSAEFHNDAAQGNVYYVPDAADTDVCALYVHTGMGKSWLTGTGTVTELQVGNGAVDIGTSIDVQTLQMSGGVANFDDSSHGHHVVRMLGGTCITERDLNTGGTVEIVGGSFVQTKPSATTSNSITINIYGGLFDWRGIFGSSVTINWYGGRIDFSKITRTATLGTLNIYPGVPGGAVEDVLEQLTITTVNREIGVVRGLGGNAGLGAGTGV